jgi:hypothetical protein
VFDLVQNRIWACTGQQYRSTKKYRTYVAPRPGKESAGVSWRMQPSALHLALSARAMMLIGLLVNIPGKFLVSA